MGFSLAAEVASRRGDGPALWDRYLNPQMHPALQAIGMDRVWERASGAWVYDSNGRPFLDLLAGFGVFGVGRGNPVVRKAVHDVLGLELADMMQLDCALLPGLLGEKLAQVSGLERAYFCNSGTEAVEAALKFARCATGRSRILYCHGGFHGLTLGALSVNGDKAFRDGFGDLLAATGIPSGDLDALEADLRKGGVAALIIEPVKAHGTEVVPDGYLTEAARLCHEYGALLICDEVQTGLGRTGKWFAYQHEPGFIPDIVTVAKALSGGLVAAGATLARDWIFRKVYSSPDRVLVHDTTFGGNAAAMAAGLATLAVIEDEDLITSAAVTGNMMLKALAGMAGEYEMIGDVRGRGLMLGVEFAEPRSRKLRTGYKVLGARGPELIALCAVAGMFRHGVLAAPAAAGLPVMRMTPPLTLTVDEAQKGIDAFGAAMKEMHGGRAPMVRFAGRLAAWNMAARFPGAVRRVTR